MNLPSKDNETVVDCNPDINNCTDADGDHDHNEEVSILLIISLMRSPGDH
jgi:hypothetical protein